MELAILIVLVSAMLIIYLAFMRVLYAIKSTNILLKQIAYMIGVPEPSEDPILQDYLSNGNKNRAIKRYREITGRELKEATNYIENLFKGKDAYIR